MGSVASFTPLPDPTIDNVEPTIASVRWQIVPFRNNKQAPWNKRMRLAVCHDLLYSLFVKVELIHVDNRQTVVQG